MIPFNKPFIAGKELDYIAKAIELGNIGGDGYFTKQCSRFLENRFEIDKILLTASCTGALEMVATICNLGPGDEVILPSFTFVSTASAVTQRGATPVFVDIRPDTLNMNEDLVESALTDRTKAIIPVHYAGVACDMNRLKSIAERHDVWLVEDAAQGVNSFYKERALGSMGHLATYSFHETKNITCGEGGALCINEARLVERAEIIRDKGTNRRQFFRGEVDRYTWVDQGSSHVPSEICSAFLFGQLEMLDTISARRQKIYERYADLLSPLEGEGLVQLPTIPSDCRPSYHMFYILLRDQGTRDGLMRHLRQRGINAVFHYVPLHSSPMGQRVGRCHRDLRVTESASSRLLRLPFYPEITHEEQRLIATHLTAYVEASRQQSVNR